MSSNNLPALAHGHRKKWSFGSLLFSSFYFTPYFLYANTLQWQQMVFGSLIYLAFVLAYVVAVYSPARRVHWPIMAIMLIATVSVKWNPAGLIFFGFGNFILGYHYTRVRAFIALFAAMCLQALSSYFFASEYGMFVWPTIFTSVSLFMFGCFERKEQGHRQAQQQSNEQLQQMSAIAERERIGRDLHDVAGHALSSIALKAELASKLLDKSAIAQAQKEINELAAVSRQLLSDIRQAVSNIKLQPLQDELQQAVLMLRKRGLRVSTHFDLSPLDIEQEFQIIMIVKELTTNIIKHSKGDKVSIEVEVSEHNVRLCVADNGQSSDLLFGNGLTGITQRIAPFHGSLETSLQEGVKIQINMERA